MKPLHHLRAGVIGTGFIGPVHIEAQQLLDAQKSEERAMLFQPENLRTNKPRDRVFKDW